MTIDCPCCARVIAATFGDWLWNVTNCPFCLAPLSPAEDELSEGKEFYLHNRDAILKAQSEVPTPYGVFCVETFDVGKPPCNGGEIIYLTEEAYGAQMDMPDARWKCPLCGGEARWSDDNFEKFYEEESDGPDAARSL